MLPVQSPSPDPLNVQVCNIYAAPSSVSARGGSTSPRTSSGPSRPNISAPAAKPKSPSSAAEPVSAAERNGGPAEAAKKEVTSKEEEEGQVGTKEAATKASKELEVRLAKLGTNISKADAMAVAEKVRQKFA